MDLIKGVLVGIILIVVGIMLTGLELGSHIFVQVGWVFLFGGFVLIAISIFSVIRR